VIVDSALASLAAKLCSRVTNVGELDIAMNSMTACSPAENTCIATKRRVAFKQLNVIRITWVGQPKCQGWDRR